jgi:hypothetical protein
VLKRATVVGLIAGLTAAMSAVACRPPQPDTNPPPPATPPPQVVNPGQPTGPPRHGANPAQPTATPSPTIPPPAIDGKMTIRAAMPIRWSTKIDPQTRRALETGRRRLVINVSAYEPPTSGPAILVANLLTANGTKREEVARFAVHPKAPFRASETVEPQRFQVSLADYAKLLETSEIHLEVGFDSSEGQLQGGMAEISIEFIDF